MKLLSVGLVFSLLGASACASGERRLEPPPLVRCLSSYVRQEFDCLEVDGETSFEWLYTDPRSDKLICYPIQDHERLMKWATRRSGS